MQTHFQESTLILILEKEKLKGIAISRVNLDGITLSEQETKAVFPLPPIPCKTVTLLLDHSAFVCCAGLENPVNNTHIPHAAEYLAYFLL